jgi:hypothetical protein
MQRPARGLRIVPELEERRLKDVPASVRQQVCPLTIGDKPLRPIVVSESVDF